MRTTELEDEKSNAPQRWRVASRSARRPVPGRARLRHGVSRFSIAISSLSLLLASDASAQRNEIEVKAAFLVHFARYVDWPPERFDSDDASIVVGILGDPEFFETASSIIEAKPYSERSVELKRIDSVARAQQTHILFIGRSLESKAREIRLALDDAPVFGVADFEGHAERGGTAHFFMKDGRVRFAVNPEAARSRGLTVSSQLLRVATVVE